MIILYILHCLHELHLVKFMQKEYFIVENKTEVHSSATDGLFILCKTQISPLWR